VTKSSQRRDDALKLDGTAKVIRRVDPPSRENWLPPLDSGGDCQQTDDCANEKKLGCAEESRQPQDDTCKPYESSLE
jgi:hypothetical protein